MLINKDDYLTSIDLADAFLHVLVHQSSRRFLQFAWEGQLFQFRVLPFGLSLSPLVFTKVLRPILRWARRKGIRVAAYLDDLLIVAKDYRTSHLHTQQILRKLAELGFLVKNSKSNLTPSQCIQHLGFVIDTTKMLLSVPTSKIRDLRREASRLIRRTTCSVRHLAAFIGKAQALTMAVFPARLMSRSLLADKNAALHHNQSWTAMIHLSQPALMELRWWYQQLQTWNGQSFLPTTPQHEVFTDASDSGWGIVWNNRTWKGLWTPHEAEYHINLKELLVIWKVLQLQPLQGSAVKVYCDNMTTIAYVNKFGGTRSTPLMDLSRRIWDFCLRTNTRIHLSYVPSAFNPADSPSRQLTRQLEWRIAPTYFRKLERKWGPHQVDMFASNQNHLLPHYVSWKWDPQALATDAMSLHWQTLGNVYLCPPWNLLSAIVAKLQREPTSATLITPWWPSAIWFPTLQHLAQPRPLKVPRHLVLPPVGQSVSVLSANPHWSLTAWRIKSAA
jgi:hypothetical protein